MKFIFILLSTLFVGCSGGWNYFGNHNKMRYEVDKNIPNPYPIPIVNKFHVRDVTFFQPLNWLGKNKGSSNLNYSNECNCVPYAYHGGMGFGAYVINDSFLLDQRIINGYDGRKWNKEYFFFNYDRKKNRIEKYINSFDSTKTPYISVYPPEKFNLLYATEYGNMPNFHNCVSKSFVLFLNKNFANSASDTNRIVYIDSIKSKLLLDDLNRFEFAKFKGLLPVESYLNKVLNNISTTYACFTIFYQIKYPRKAKGNDKTETFIKYYILNKYTKKVEAFNYVLIENKYLLPLYPTISANTDIEEVPVKIFKESFEKLFQGIFNVRQ